MAEPKTLGQRVSDDPRHFISRRQKMIFDKNVRRKICPDMMILRYYNTRCTCMFALQKGSNKESTKAARATRSGHATHVPRCSVGLHGSFLRLRKRTTFDENFARKASWRSRKWMTTAAQASPTQQQTHARTNEHTPRKSSEKSHPECLRNEPGKAKIVEKS